MGNTPLPASPFSTESAHRWDYLSASVGFPSAPLLLWESAVISLMIMELSASVRPVSDVHMSWVPRCTPGRIIQ